MLLGVIADDFTGASDIANTIAKGLPGQGGLKTAQFLGVPTNAALPDIEAGVVALKTRSVPADIAVAESLAALEWLIEQGCEQIVFKYCSTFDSTPAGNIGPVGEALARRLETSAVVVCPAFPEAGRTVYQGHLFVNDRLLSESGMQNHPLTPMTDPDIRRWLGRQTALSVAHVPLMSVKQGCGAISDALSAAKAYGAGFVVVDAVNVDDLVAIGTACMDARLVTGGSGIASGLPANFIKAGRASGQVGAGFIGQSGPEAILAGSCSGATRGQVDQHKLSHPSYAIDVDAVMNGELSPQDVCKFLLDHVGSAPIAYSSSTPEQVREIQEKYGREIVAETLDEFFAATARILIAGGVRRIVVAGGETSGAVVSALDLSALTIGAEIDPGVPVLSEGGPDGIALALKSGNFGSVDFFEKALERLAGR